jgi:hypothetical protein
MLKLLTLLSLLSLNFNAYSFCGFYVAKASTDLYNKSSKVVLVRDQDRTVLTMQSDYLGSAKDFAMIIPVPEVLQKGQIGTIEKKFIDRIDAFTAPRLVEYFDPSPCRKRVVYSGGVKKMKSTSAKMAAPSAHRADKAYGVTIKAQYAVGEYDILILDAKKSNGLLRWLNDNQYKVPKKAEPILNSYIKQGLKFFVAQVNIKRLEKSGTNQLKPIRIAYNSNRFMLPVRLGTVNSQGEQELFVFALTKKGRVTSNNYRTVAMETSQEIPAFVKKEFKSFYLDLFKEKIRKDGNTNLYMEYAWNMGWCDPCASNPLTSEELKKLGVYWLDEPNTNGQRLKRGRGALPVFVTRLHARYNAQSFPADIMFNVTNNQANFQNRYIIRHPWKGDMNECAEAKNYFTQLSQRQEKRAQTLANLTGRDINQIRGKMNIRAISGKGDSNWWKKLNDDKADTPKKDKKETWWDKIF